METEKATTDQHQIVGLPYYEIVQRGKWWIVIFCNGIFDNHFIGSYPTKRGAIRIINQRMRRGSDRP